MAWCGWSRRCRWSPAQGALAECRQLLDIAFPPVARGGRAGECARGAARRWSATAIAAQGGPAAAEPFRAALVEALRQGPARDAARRRRR